MSKISFVILISVLFSSGCSTVKPWQRGYLSEDVMSASADPLRSSLDNHIYFSKEGSSGGGQSAGGGCGCN
ncbi:hypothetical protein A9R00_06475 [Oleispira antarctica]|uniref:DUF4266 domain-containing protein n=1 Tax=Oleispira antarctica TaxID=188908 RepID=A0A1Y5HTF2_OLEAN|nr:hypothetical protein A9R00_06475 [Oleispira antarctica]